MENENNKNSDILSVVKEGKTIGIIAYLTLIGLIIAFVMNNEKKNSFASFHIRQSLGIGLFGLVFYVLGLVPFIGWIISIFGTILLIVLWIIGLMGALNGEEKPVPIIGEKIQELLEKV